MHEDAKNEKPMPPKVPVTPPPIEHVRRVMECFCDLYTEGLTITELDQRTELQREEIMRVLTAYKGLFSTTKFEIAKATIQFIYLRRGRSLRCAYTLFKYSNISSLDFDWDQKNTEFIFEMTNPKYTYRTFKSLRIALDWTPKQLHDVIVQWQDEGLICKKGKQVVFTYLGWPMWAAIMVARIWMQEDTKDAINSYPGFN